MKKNKKGFTLIELLVVIAIIGLLSTLSIVALNQARARSRDARRLADIKQIQTALEMYYNDLAGYPASLGTTIASNSIIYMDIVPTPPTPGDGATCIGSTVYTYTLTTINGITNGSYTLKYCLGSATGGLTAGQKVATPSGISLTQ